MHFFVVPGSESRGELVNAALVYSQSMSYRAWSDDLDVILFTGHCWAAESRKGPRVGDICVISGAHNTTIGKQDVKKPAAPQFAVVHHVCKQMQTAKSGRWQEPGVIMERPKVSYRWQALWITRLHYEISKVKEGKVISTINKQLQVIVYVIKARQLSLHICLTVTTVSLEVNDMNRSDYFWSPFFGHVLCLGL